VLEARGDVAVDEYVALVADVGALVVVGVELASVVDVTVVVLRTMTLEPTG